MSIKRRTLLKGFGTALFAPFVLDALGSRKARAQSALPARLVIVVECNGIYPRSFLSDGAAAALGSAIGDEKMFSNHYPDTPLLLQGDALSTAVTLGPLAAGGASLVERSAVLLGLSSTITGGGHSSGTGALSCATNGSAPTFDAVIAPTLRRGAPFDALRLGTSASLSSTAYETCSLGPRKPAPILVKPALAYDATFGSLLGTSSRSAERRALFDFARADVNAALATFRGNSNERIKLERYLASLEALNNRELLMQGMAESVRPLLPPLPSVNPLLADTGGDPDSLAWIDAQFEIATASLLGGLTNNVVLASGTSGFDVTYPSDITDLRRHDLQHEIENGGNFALVAAVTTRHVELIARLARTLAATPEVGASGSMLDHTAIVFMSDNGEQHHSTGREWPILVVGGNALGLKTDGRTVIFPAEGQANNRQVSNLFNSLGHAFGDADMNEFGREGPLRIAEGPLSEIYGT